MGRLRVRMHPPSGLGVEHRPSPAPSPRHRGVRTATHYERMKIQEARIQMRLALSLELCDGNALCALTSPMLFDMDENTGRGVVLVDHPDGAQRAEAMAAVRVCPAGAITLEEDGR